RAGEPELRAGRDDQEVPADRAAAHRRGRRAHADDEAQAQVREREVHRHDRRHVCRGGLVRYNRNHGGLREEEMKKSTIGLGIAIAAATSLVTAGASAQTRGVTATEILLGMHTDLS